MVIKEKEAMMEQGRPGRTTRRQEAAAGTRARILSAARARFAQHGFEAVTTEQIAEAAGVAKGTLFLHARTKERLLVMVYEHELAESIRLGLAKAPRGGTIVAALSAVFRRFFKVHEQDPALARRFIAHLVLMGHDGGPGLRRVQEAALAGLAALVDKRKARGEVAADVDSALAASNSFLLYYGVLTGWLSGWLPDPVSRDHMLQTSLELHWRGLLRPTTKTEGRRS